MMGGYGMYGGYGFGGIFMVLWWGLIIFGVVMLVKWASKTSSAANDSDKALEILRERYARGEINEDEFHKRKQELSK